MPKTLKPGLTTILTISLVSFVCGATLLTTAPAAAQDAEQIRPLVEKLPQPSRDVIDRLTELRELPDTQWKMHAGDLAHGEAVGIDDSSWQTIAPRSKAPNDAAWFRQTYEVPQTLKGYDLTGARIWFQF